QVKDDPALAAKYIQMQEARRRATAPVPRVTKESADRIRAQANEDANRLLSEITTELARRNPPRMAFEDAFPELSQNLPAIQAMTGLTLGALMKSRSNILQNIEDAPWRAAVRRGERALDPTVTQRFFLGAERDIARAEREAEVARQFMRQAQSRNALLDEVMPPLASGVAGAEIALFPHQYNLRNAPEGSPERQAAE